MKVATSVRSFAFFFHASRKNSLINSRFMNLAYHSNYVTVKPKSIVSSRLYTTVNEHQSHKISSIAVSPELAKNVKNKPKVSKMKALTKQYGAIGVLVYLGVGCIDLGLTFGIIQIAGLEKVKTIEKNTMDFVYSFKERLGFGQEQEAVGDSLLEATDKVDTETPSFASVFILAYGLHKTVLLPIRLGITAAITPSIARKITQLGWNRYFPKWLTTTTVTASKK